MKRWLTLGGLLAVVAVGPSLSSLAADWPTFRGSTRDNRSPDTGLLKTWPKEGPPQAWKESSKGIGDGFSSVSVAGNKVFTMGDVGDSCFVFCLDRDSGKKLWDTKVGKSVLSGGYKGPRCTPTVDGDFVYALGQNGELACLGLAKGNVVWSIELKDRKNFDGRVGGWGYAESPLIDGDKLLVSPGGKEASIVALNKKSGAPLWKAVVPGDRAEYSSMVISEACGVRQYVQMLHDNVVGIDAKTGKVLWSLRKLGTTANIPTPLVKGDYVVCCSGYGKGIGLLKLSGGANGIKVQEVYYKDGLGCKHGGMVMDGDHIFLDRDDRGELQCIKWLTGDVVWTRKKGKDSPGGGSASLTYADGMLYVRFQNGHMALVEANPAAYKEVSNFKIPNAKGPSWPHPVVIDGKLYVREQDQLWCYNVKK